MFEGKASPNFFERKRGVCVRAAFALACSLAALTLARPAGAQELGPRGEREFGPVVRAYLGYLRAEQEVTDARESRREVSRAYVRRNSNRILALRRMAIQIARASHNDYLPELYAVARDELGTLFESPPNPATFRVGEVLNNTFRYLGALRANEPFYLFARLDIYEQAELLKRAEEQKGQASAGQPGVSKPSAPAAPNASAAHAKNANEPATRPRRVGHP
ncbi:MAG: hypothetical protein ABR563_19300 [Pyrinomonadaceae bacterium]